MRCFEARQALSILHIARYNMKILRRERVVRLGMLRNQQRSRASSVACLRGVLARALPAAIGLGLVLSASCGLFAAIPSSSVPSLDVVLLLDSSPSTQRTDPQSERLRAAKFLVQYLQATSDAFDVNHRVGFANFGGEVRSTAPLHLVTNAPAPPDLEVIPDTDFRPALQYASREFRGVAAEPNRRLVVVLFTDGNPGFGVRDLMGSELSRYFRGENFDGNRSALKLNTQVQALAQAGIELFVVAIRPTDEAARFWNELIPGRFLKLNDAQEILPSYHAILGRLLGFSEANRLRVDEGNSYDLRFPPLTEQAAMFFFKDRGDAEISIRNDSGVSLPRSSGGQDVLYESFLVQGLDLDRVWHVRARGGGGLLLSAMRPARLIVESPLGPQSTTAGLEAVVSLMGGDRRQRLEDLRISAEIEIPGGGRRSSDLVSMPQGAYRLAVPELNKPGTYTLTFTAQLEGNIQDSLNSSASVELVDLPEILGIEMGARAQQATARREIRLRVVHAPDPQWLPEALLVGADGEVLEKIPLSPAASRVEGQAVYRGTVMLPGQVGGLRIVARARGAVGGGLQYESKFVSPVALKEYPPSLAMEGREKSRYRSAALAVVGAAFALLILWLWTASDWILLSSRIAGISALARLRTWSQKKHLLARWGRYLPPDRRVKLLEEWPIEIEKERHDSKLVRRTVRQLLGCAKVDGKVSDLWWSTIARFSQSSRSEVAREAVMALRRERQGTKDAAAFYAQASRRGLRDYLRSNGNGRGAKVREEVYEQPGVREQARRFL